MLTFNNELETARRSILNWSDKSILKNVTIVRDVFGRLSFLLDSSVYPDQNQRELLNILLKNSLKGYYSEKIYWENISGKKKKYLQPVLDLLKKERKEWLTDQGILFYLSERPVAKKAWVYCPPDCDAVWPYEETLCGNKPRVVTFYSFKGGMGRTLQLARKGKNVVMIDTDIEAPGLATLFFDEESIRNGVLDYLLERPLSPGTDITNYILDVTEPCLLKETDGKLYILPAGSVDGNYLQKLARIDYQDNREGALRKAMCDMLDEICNRYSADYILIDSRAGFHDMGGIAVTQLPHGVVLFGNDSRQSWDGITQVIRTISESHEDHIPILLADCMCDDSTAATFLHAKEHFIQKAYAVCMENYYAEDEELPGKEAANVAHSPVFLPFDLSLKQEIILYSTGSTVDDERVNAFAKHLAAEAYKTMTGRIESWFGEGDMV